MIRFSELPQLLNGKLLQFSEEVAIETISIDSRKTGTASDTLFIAIAGERHNGHDYLQPLYDAGLRNFIVERNVPTEAFPSANVLLVSSSVTALQRLAEVHRHQFTIPVIGITGSNGKTIIKEWLGQMLSPDYVVVKNPGSYNSQVGVPLSVWLMKPYHQIGIFEAGISKPGEMKKLAQIIDPTIGIFSNIGSAHDEGFANRNEKISEKLKLFSQARVLIYCRDHEELHELIAHTPLATFTWGADPNSDVHILYNTNGVEVAYKGSSITINTSDLDKASIENTLHCIATLLWLDYDIARIQKRLTGLRVVPMRLELKEGINNCQIIDDTYNNDLGSLEIGLQFLSSLQQKRKRRAILSDIQESGLDEKNLASSIGEIVRRYNIHNLVCIGPALLRHRESFPEGTLFFNETKDFLNQFDFSSLDNEVVLVKGARKFAFERIVARLQRKVHGTVVEIDFGALVHNLNYFKSLLSPTTKVMVMVKAFAYGSGSTEIANLLQYHQADYLGVAYADEGIDLRKNNITLPIMVMNPSEESFDAMLKFNLEPEVYTIRILRSLAAYLNGASCKVHVKIDTGMRRLGFSPDEVPELLEVLEAHRNIRVASIFSHLAGADEEIHDAFSQQQFDTFVEASTRIITRIGYQPLRHILNTSGILRLSRFQLDMVRLGIGLYGVDPTAEQHGLKTVVTLKTIISQIKHVHKGETVGYGRRGITDRDITTGTIAIGYADGYSRAFSRGVGKVLVNGQLAPVIGNVCMDMTMIDLSGIEAGEGDEVIIFGKDLPVQDLADSIKSIPYEILTSTSERVRRVFVTDTI
ncbi:bifunctional UDP-N-acetylmuramoyl-tripeptide:D-alanyl-D-alanine ligase/alanine racemase [Chryseolinea sp. T2]|uniref:bifunctional UDP-N-acetylmuramoyl-tripeptide:D-alanyl-D-alanine ligase/alanine racemase n=1 Tax=Chryseolinea sp. T2 TaxID=3129255 RepID=UPI0030773EAF